MTNGSMKFFVQFLHKGTLCLFCANTKISTCKESFFYMYQGFTVQYLPCHGIHLPPKYIYNLKNTSKSLQYFIFSLPPGPQIISKVACRFNTLHLSLVFIILEKRVCLLFYGLIFLVFPTYSASLSCPPLKLLKKLGVGRGPCARTYLVYLENLLVIFDVPMPLTQPSSPFSY